jgi:hypothetical protein
MVKKRLGKIMKIMFFMLNNRLGKVNLLLIQNNNEEEKS